MTEDYAYEILHAQPITQKKVREVRFSGSTGKRKRDLWRMEIDENEHVEMKGTGFIVANAEREVFIPAALVERMWRMLRPQNDGDDLLEF